MVNWTAADISATELELAAKIAQRATVLKLLHDRRKFEIMMDIVAVHISGNPLRLQDFLDGPREDFSHDIFGIFAHLDRRTGKLLDFFEPRFTDYDRLREE